MKITTALKSVMLMGESYQIQRRKVRRGIWADVDPVTRRIRMSQELDDIGFRKVLGHEMAHIVLANTGLSIQLSPEAEEKYCDALGPALVALIEENT